MRSYAHGRLGRIAVLPVRACCSGADSFAKGAWWQVLRQYFTPVTQLAAPERLGAGWWSLLSAAETEGEELALREDYVAQSPHAGLLWVYRRRSAGEPALFLQGVYG